MTDIKTDVSTTTFLSLLDAKMQSFREDLKNAALENEKCQRQIAETEKYCEQLGYLEWLSDKIIGEVEKNMQEINETARMSIQAFIEARRELKKDSKFSTEMKKTDKALLSNPQ